MKTKEYELVMDLLAGLNLDPNRVESIHIDHDNITVVGFEFSEDGKKIIPDQSGGGALRVATNFKMHSYTSEGAWS